MATGILAMLAPKSKGSASADEPDEGMGSADEMEPEGNVRKLLRVAVEAIADGDTDAAVDALEGALETCMKDSSSQPAYSKYSSGGG